MRLGYKRYILIYLGAILLMSHIISNNVSAFDFSSNLRFRYSLSSNGLYWTDEVDTTWRNSGFKNYGRGQARQGAVYFKFSNANRNLTASQGDIVVITGTFYSTSAYGGTSNTSGAIYAGSENLRCTIIDLEASDTYVDNVSTNSDLITYYQNFTLTCNLTANITDYIATNLRLETSGQNLVDYSGISFKNMFVFYKDTSLYDIYNWLQNNSDDAGSTLKQEKQDVQDASDNSETVSDNNSENAATTNLIGAFSSLLSALTSLNATNCNVTLPFPSALGGNMTVNICQNKDYAGNIISVFGSLTLCVFYVPLALKLLSMIYNEIRSFTNG